MTLVYYMVSGLLIRRLGIRGNRVQFAKIVERPDKHLPRVKFLDRLAARLTFTMRHDVIAALACVLLLLNFGMGVAVLFAFLSFLQTGYVTVYLLSPSRKGGIPASAE